MAARIEWAPAAVIHLEALTKNEQTQVVDNVVRYLTDQPTLASRKRKHLQPNLLAQWELRLGELRVFYDVQTEPPSEDGSQPERTTVTIRAVGKKFHNELRIGGRKVQL